MTLKWHKMVNYLYISVCDILSTTMPRCADCSIFVLYEKCTDCHIHHDSLWGSNPTMTEKGDVSPELPSKYRLQYIGKPPLQTQRGWHYFSSYFLKLVIIALRIFINSTSCFESNANFIIIINPARVSTNTETI